MMRNHPTRMFMVCRLLPVVLALTLATVSAAFSAESSPLSGAALLAQFDEPPLDTAPARGFQFGVSLKIAAVVLLVLLGVFVIWPPLYRLLLEREDDGVWPLTLYGRLAAIFWFVFWMGAVGILWYDLPVKRQAATFLSEHGMRCLLVAIALVGALSLMLVFRSNRPKARDAGELASGD